MYAAAKLSNLVVMGFSNQCVNRRQVNVCIGQFTHSTKNTYKIIPKFN